MKLSFKRFSYDDKNDECNFDCNQNNYLNKSNINEKH